MQDIPFTPPTEECLARDDLEAMARVIVQNFQHSIDQNLHFTPQVEGPEGDPNINIVVGDFGEAP